MATAIDSLSTFIAEIAQLKLLDHGRAGPFWFRGQGDAAWKLVPGALRENFVDRAEHLDASPDDGKSEDLREAVERLINDEFRREGASMLPAWADIVDIYFLAQHHGLPTRLLDWTANPLAALFVAASEAPEETGEVVAVVPDWRLSFPDGSQPEGLPGLPLGQRHPLVVETVQYLFGEGPRPDQALILPVQPDLRSSRMFQQAARFTLHMPRSRPIDESQGITLVVPQAKKQALVEELRAIGINWATLFPDLDHLGQEIRHRRKLRPQ